MGCKFFGCFRQFYPFPPFGRGNNGRKTTSLLVQNLRCSRTRNTRENRNSVPKRFTCLPFRIWDEFSVHKIVLLPLRSIIPSRQGNTSMKCKFYHFKEVTGHLRAIQELFFKKVRSKNWFHPVAVVCRSDQFLNETLFLTSTMMAPGTSKR